MEFFLTGDQLGFEHLYRRFKRPIFNFLLRFSGDPEAAADLTQEVFGKVIARGRSFRAQSKLKTWLYAIARNTAVDAARKASHRRAASLDQPSRNDGPTLAERTAGNEPAPDRGLTTARIRRDLARAIAELPEEQREVFLLREYHGMPFDEIAEVVGARVGTIKSRMRYALGALRRDLEQYREHMRSLP